MKKLVLTAAVFFAFTTATFAQQRNQDGPPKKPTTEQMMKRFDDLNLTSAQKRKLETLFQERQAKFEKNKPEHFAKNGERPTRNSGEQKDFKAKMDKERSEFDKKIKKILTNDQYAKFKAQQPQRMGMKKDKANFDKANRPKTEKRRG